jgi:hypothetical protein
MSYYNFETMFRSLKDKLTAYLKENSIYYELSGAAANWHIEILTDPTGAEKINNYIESITISEVR